VPTARNGANPLRGAPPAAARRPQGGPYGEAMAMMWPEPGGAAPALRASPWP
jgi:hypothetical protein